jgi:hypothetical protein
MLVTEASESSMVFKATKSNSKGIPAYAEISKDGGT